MTAMPSRACARASGSGTPSATLGPGRGIGSKAKVRVSAAGRADTIEIEVIAAQPPARIVERNVGAGGRRVANGTYVLSGIAGGGTRIEFEYAWQRAPLSERLASPLVRWFMRRANQEAMRRLAEQFAVRESVELET